MVPLFATRAQVVAHKTFHRYVVRAKRGTAQSTRDGQGNAPKSGGASLRRYNEAALTQVMSVMQCNECIIWKRCGIYPKMNLYKIGYILS